MLIRTMPLDERVAVLDLTGRLDVESAIGLREAVCATLGTGRRQLVLDLIGLSDVDAAGLGELAYAFSSVRAAGGELRVVVQCSIVYELLARTHLLDLFMIFPTQAQALTSLEMAGGPPNATQCN
jgi:anti-sigma B factor antagonist